MLLRFFKVGDIIKLIQNEILSFGGVGVGRNFKEFNFLKNCY